MIRTDSSLGSSSFGNQFDIPDTCSLCDLVVNTGNVLIVASSRDVYLKISNLTVETSSVDVVFCVILIGPFP